MIEVASVLIWKPDTLNGRQEFETYPNARDISLEYNGILIFYTDETKLRRIVTNLPFVVEEMHQAKMD